MEELPEQVTVTEVHTEEGPKQQVTKKRVIKKRVGDKEETTEILTVTALPDFSFLGVKSDNSSNSASGTTDSVTVTVVSGALSSFCTQKTKIW